MFSLNINHKFNVHHFFLKARKCVYSSLYLKEKRVNTNVIVVLRLPPAEIMCTFLVLSKNPSCYRARL